MYAGKESRLGFSLTAMSRFIFFLTLALVALSQVVVASERLNKSASYWSSSKEEGDLVRKENIDDSSSLWNKEDDHDLDGGFSSLDGMLQWAIGHSDPAKLKEKVQEIKHLSPDEIKARQMKIKELMEVVQMPSDAKLMQIALDDLNNVSLPVEDHLRALQELLVFVEPIDNANDLQKLGGLPVIVRELNHADTEIRTASAWVLGTASQNNPFIQNHLLQLGALAKLMTMVKSKFSEEAIKALYAISALIRNNSDGQELFYAEAGDLMLQDILSNSSIDIRLQKKAIFLVADLAEYQLGVRNTQEPRFFSNPFLLKSLVDLLASMDLDLQEKALYAVKSLLRLKSTKASVFKDICKLDEALEQVGERLQHLLTDENQREYALDVEQLRVEVLQIFLGKLDKVEEKEESSILML